MSEKTLKMGSAKNQQKEVIFGGTIRDKGVAFILWDKYESKHLLKCSHLVTLKKIILKTIFKGVNICGCLNIIR